MPKSIKDWQKEIHELAKTKGWWEKPRTALEIHALVHSEIAEATEAARSGLPPVQQLLPKPEGEATELADAVIRILDWFEFNGWDLEQVMELKHTYNQTRSYRHGGKLA